MMRTLSPGVSSTWRFPEKMLKPAAGSAAVFAFGAIFRKDADGPIRYKEVTA